MLHNRVQSKHVFSKNARQVNKYLSCTIFAILLFFLAGCVTTNAGGNTPSTIKLTQTDKGKSITVHPGDEIVITLPENPSTGYSWATDKIDESMLTSQTSTTSSTPGAAIGTGGARTFSFRARQSGTVHLQLKLFRAWQGDSSIIDRFDATIQIQA
jgi:inhibitor of cysteine peptidase